MTTIRYLSKLPKPVSALLDLLEDDMLYYLGAFSVGGDSDEENARQDMQAIGANAL